MRNTLAALLCLLLMTQAQASILSGSSLKINFRDPADAKQKATWSDPEKSKITKDGLEGTAWIKTEPLGTGLSWRTLPWVSVTVHVHPKQGSVYVRHSPDAKHWSDWQPLQPANDNDGEAGIYRGTVGVPGIQRMEYAKLWEEYSKLDVPWKDDEESLAKWIVERDPNFFRDHKPFVGYVQVLYESPGRLRGMTVGTYFGVSGLHTSPKDSDVYKDRQGPWRFKAP